MEKDYLFYVSYSRADLDKYMERFFHDLIDEVRLISGVPGDRVAFLDRNSIDLGREWPSSIKEGLDASRVLLCMFSPAYFSHSATLQEFEFFRVRTEAAATQRGGARPRLIVPVLWASEKFLHNVPAEIKALNWYSPEFPEEYREDGLRLLLRFSHRRNGYRRFVTKLAEAIVDLAAAAPSPWQVSRVDRPLATIPTVAVAAPPEAPTVGKLRAFLCHASDDKPRVRALFEQLKEDGIEPWLDELNLLPGQRWEIEIPRALRMSHAVIICLSTRAVDKVGYINKEIKFALDAADEQPDGSMFLIPVKLEECKIPDRLKHFHVGNLYEPGGYSRLMNALELRANQLEL
ncbi:MAG TPA: toll/interleukin-1 receptor domain-containing protein [Longimicrobium sp.]|nr:toll/interleukin-1 receptor domain-containing protein [Longimicrobium sp.]